MNQPRLTSAAALSTIHPTYHDFNSTAHTVVLHQPSTGSLQASFKPTGEEITAGSTAITELMSVAYDGSPANELSDVASISVDGHFEAFLSNASNLVAGDTNGKRVIFIVDLRTRIFHAAWRMYLPVVAL